jgi:NAD(P)-dependent dehydrogenase (short-subunit alcohol dehydrogenase family)
MKSYEDKVAAITGAGSGMGRELALELVRARAHVALADINRETLEETAEKVRALGGRVTTSVLDVSKREAVHAWADAVVRDFGRVNLIFNNAGVALGSTLEGVSYEDFEWLMGINFWGVVYGTKAFLPHLRASGDGHVVNVSSIFGLFSVAGSGTYNASKFAVRGFTEALRQELELTGANVSATSVHPGGIKTNIAKAGRMSPSVTTLTNRDPEIARADFEKMFITTANRAAQIILRAVKKDRRRVLVGPDAVILDMVVRLLPTSYQRIVEAFVKREAAQ